MIKTPAVLIAAGPWSGQVGQLAGIRLPIEPLRRQLAVTRTAEKTRRDLPFVIDFSESLYFHYEGGGILTGMSNPDEKPGFSQKIDEEWREVHLEKAVQRLPLLADAQLVNEWAGLYEMTPDCQPILGAVEKLRGLYVCAGFSGHGFMHGPACGLLLTEEILEGKASTINIDELRLSRLESPDTVGEFNVI
jgi:sarcosine oxidase subunit beta